MSNILLYAITALIWGTTWLAIKFQLGVVDPLVSIVYRFLISVIILMVYCRMKKLKLSYTFKEHLFFVLQGFFLFGINYWFVYLAEESLASGLVSIIFSTIIFMNVLNGAIFLGSPVRGRVIAGAVVGILGIILVFRKDLSEFDLTSDSSIAFLTAFVGVIFASFGNIISARNQKNNLPVIQTNAFGMLYGGLIMLALALILQKPFNFEMSFSYISSLLYLALFGSVIAFTCYLTLVGKIGADKASYVTLIFPIIALMLSTVFEGYIWTISAIFGVILILLGSLIVLIKKKNSASYI